jgi:hypothetical protein
MPAEVDIVNPIAKLLNPEIELPTAGVNALLDIIPNTVSSTVKNITGLVLPSESISVPDLVLVSPNPSAFSGPINTHRSPLYTCKLFVGDLNQKAPPGGPSGGVSETTADPTTIHLVPS